MFTPDATPACTTSTAASTVAVNGATIRASPSANTTTAGNTSATYVAVAPIRVIMTTPTAHTSGPSVIGSRGPIRSANWPARAESSSITTVTGSNATPASSGEKPVTT